MSRWEFNEFFKMEESVNRNQNETTSVFKSKKFLMAGGGFVALLVIGAGIFYFSGGYADRQEQKAAQQKLTQAEEVQRRLEEAYRNDTYGGKTPQETLDLFVAALRAGDVELASKYFALDDNLGRGDWYANLVKAKNEDRFSQIIAVLERATPDLENRTSENDFKFVVYKKNSELEADINMELSPLTKVWKIESL